MPYLNLPSINLNTNELQYLPIFNSSVDVLAYYIYVIFFIYVRVCLYVAT